MEFSKKIVTAIVALVILFTIAVLIIFLKTGSEPTVLEGCFFAFVTGELWALASIKKVKSKSKIGGKKNDEINN